MFEVCAARQFPQRKMIDISGECPDLMRPVSVLPVAFRKVHTHATLLIKRSRSLCMLYSSVGTFVSVAMMLDQKGKTNGFVEEDGRMDGGIEWGTRTDFLAATSLPHSLHKAHVSELVVG